MATVDPEKYRRVKFVDDLSPITADILNDNQALLFDSFENLRLVASGNKIILTVDEDGYDHSGANEFGMIVAAGRIRYLSDGNPPEHDASGESAGDYYIQVDPGNDTGKYTNSNLDTLDLKLSPGAATPDNERNIGVTHWDGTSFENTETIAGGAMRSRQFNAFTFESIDGNSIPLSITGLNNRHPNLFVESHTEFIRPPVTPDGLGYNPDNPNHENWYEVVDAHGGIQTSHIYADNPEKVIVLQDHVHVAGSLTVDEDIIFDQTQLGELGASPWDNLSSAASVQEFADSTFEGLLPNPSHAPINFYPLGTIIEWAVGLNFVIDDPKTWPIGWVPAVDSNEFDMDDDCTKAWLTPLYQHFEGAASVPSGLWAVPGGLPTGGIHQPFIFLGSMSYLVEDSAGDLEISEVLQGYGHKFSDIVVS